MKSHYSIVSLVARCQHGNADSFSDQCDYSPGRGAEYCDELVSPSVCLSVCLCVCPRAYLWNIWTDLHELFVQISAVAVARSSSGGVAIRYALPVLWMTSRLAVMGRVVVRGRMKL